MPGDNRLEEDPLMQPGVVLPGTLQPAADGRVMVSKDS
jgi:hypothetical protein